MINIIKEYNLVEVISMDKLTTMIPIDSEYFARFQMPNDSVISRSFKSIQLDKTFFYESGMRKNLYSCLRIYMCIRSKCIFLLTLTSMIILLYCNELIYCLLIDESTKEYTLIMAIC